jgi:uncharacterized protein (TIGR02679 family)
VSNLPDPANQNAHKAAVFFNRPGLSRMVMKLYAKYIEESQVRGQITLLDCTSDERREIASFLGKPLYADINIRIKLVDVEKALLHSFNCTLPDLLRAYYPDRALVTRVERQAQHTQRQSDFRAALASFIAQLPHNAHGRYWLEHGSHGEQWLYARYKNAPLEEQQRQLKLIAYIAGLLDQLPRPDAPERLALFAQRTSSDPHMLDAGRAAGRLFLLALSDMASEQRQADAYMVGTTLTVALENVTGTLENVTITPENVVGDREQELMLYRNAGLLVDTISTNVAAYNLASAFYLDGTSDPMLHAAGARVMLLPLRQLQEWKSVTSSSEAIYVVENPQVFEEIIASVQAENEPPTLVCTSGWPSVAALTVLDLLLSACPTYTLHYSGDFDARGLQIAAYMLARYPGRCHLWRFDRDTYSAVLRQGGIAAPVTDLALLDTLPEIFAPLVDLMQEKAMWAYQEGITHFLIDDITQHPHA